MKINKLNMSFTKNPVGLLLSRLGMVMFLFTITRLIFYIFNQHLFLDIDNLYLIGLFLAGLRFDLTAVIYFNLLYIFLFLIPHKIHHHRLFLKYTNILFYITNGIALFLNSVDFIYYRFTNRRTTMMVFNEFAGEKNYGALLYHFAIDYYYVPLICGALIFFLFWTTKNQQIEKSRLNGWKYFLFNTIIMTILLTLTTIGVRGGLPPKQDFPLNPSDAGQYVKDPNDIGIVLNTAFTMLLSSDKPAYPKQNYYVSDSELDSIYTPVHQADTTRIKRKLNVVVIMVESLGRETIGFYNRELQKGKYIGYTPFLDSLCSHALVFKNSYANSHISIEGSPAVIASIPSLQESYTVSLYSGNKIMSLASCLKNIGYQTLYFHGAPNGSLGLNSFAKVAGFEKYVGKNEYNNDDDFDGVWGIWDHKFLPFMANTLDKQKEPFFSFVFTTSSHHPFRIPDSLINKFHEGTEKIHKSISYTDYALKVFFEEASKKSWYNNTVFVITGDHTCTAHFNEFRTNVGHYAVPIIFYQPGINLHGINYQTAQQIDIMPTILDYIGYPKTYFAFGQDLFERNKNKFAISYIGNVFQFIQNDWVLQFNLKKTTALYNLKYDRKMKINLVGKVAGVQLSMEKQVKAFIQQYNNRMVDDRMLVE